MTEAEWLACTEPGPMLEFLRGNVSDRKLRLLACGCLRGMWHLLDDDRIREAVRVAERLADGWATREEVGAAASAAEAAFLNTAVRFRADDPAMTSEALMAYFAERFLLDADALFAARHAAGFAVETHCGGTCELIRDVFPPPSRKMVCSQAWRVPDVLALAETLYDHHAFDRMPELADLLEAAGCDSADILEHLRGPGSHVRGCWVVDTLLDKS